MRKLPGPTALFACGDYHSDLLLMAPSSGDHLFTRGAIYLPPHKESVQRGDPKAYPDANQRPATLELN